MMRGLPLAKGSDNLSRRQTLSLEPTLGAVVLPESKRTHAMLEWNTKRSGRDVRGVRVFVALGLVIGLLFIIVGGWLMNSQNRDTTSNSAHLRTPAATTGLR
jgi:hypothetical protein